MTKKRIAEVYRFLAAASMKRLQDEEKIKLFPRLLKRVVDLLKIGGRHDVKR